MATVQGWGCLARERGWWHPINQTYVMENLIQNQDCRVFIFWYPSKTIFQFFLFKTLTALFLKWFFTSNHPNRLKFYIVKSLSFGFLRFKLNNERKLKAPIACIWSISSQRSPILNFNPGHFFTCFFLIKVKLLICHRR